MRPCRSVIVISAAGTPARRMRAQPIIAALVAFAVLFASIARVPGGMLSFDGGLVSYEICTSDGVQQISLPSDDPAPDTGCDFFAAQVAALLGAGPSPQMIDLRAGLIAGVQASLSNARIAAFEYPIRGPPRPS